MAELIIDAPVTGPDAPQASAAAGTNKDTLPVQQPAQSGESSQGVTDSEGAAEPQGEGVTQGSEDGSQNAAQEAADALEIAGLDMSELAAEYTRDGKLSDESYKELEENGFPKAIVDAYIRGIEAQNTTVKEFADAEVKELQALAGDAGTYGKMMTWAGEVFSEEEKEAYNQAVLGGNKHTAAFAIRGLVARYEQEYGHEPQLIGGGAASTQAGGFKNKSEMVDAMSDRRYGRDAEYTKEVEGKVLRSGLMRRR